MNRRQTLRLLNDITRCLDHACPSKHTCLRWLTGQSDPKNFIGSYCMTLRDTDDANSCNSYIPNN